MVSKSIRYYRVNDSILSKKKKPEVDIDRAEWSLFLSNRYLKCLKQSCYPSFIVSQLLEFGDVFVTTYYHNHISLLNI